MIRRPFRYAALAGVLGIGACKLDVSNPNSPETQRVLGTPTDVEAFLGNYYRRWHSGMYSTTGNVWGMAQVESFEDYSSLSNNCMGQRVGIPRAVNDNSIGNGCEGEQKFLYNRESEVERVASSIIATLDKTPLGSPAQNLRAKAFAEFLRGVSIGYLAMTYDSVAVITPETSAEDPGTLTGYQEAMTAATDALQKAIDYTNQSASATGGNGFPLPGNWIPSSTTFTAPEFVRLIRSYRARFRANVARTPTEGAAVNWDAVIADAQNGITADHDNITTSTATGQPGPYNAWVAQWYTYGTWHQMTPFVIGMGDVSGAYEAWLQQPLATRGNTGSFTMVTPDQRFPQGANRAAQQADFALTSCTASGTTCKRYFVNRPSGNDPSGGNAWGASNYDHARFYAWAKSGDAGQGGQFGKFPFFTKAELDMLQAEGQIRKGNFSAAAALINVTRTKNGLPAITAFDNTTPVPGGANCVPRVPVGPTFTTTACGNMFEAMKWEKRLETAYTHFMAWFLDSRRWGDLPAGTGLDWAAPYQDLQARGRTSAQIYSTGGGLYHSAAKGTYGW